MQNRLDPCSDQSVPPTDTLARDFSYEVVQKAVDEIFDLRSKVIRIGLLGTLLYRPDPVREIPCEERQGHLDLLKAQVHHFGEVTALMADGDPHSAMSPQMCRWIHQLSLQKPEELALVRRVDDIGKRVLRAATQGDAQQSALLAEHMRVARGGFHEAITALCDHMWIAYDTSRMEALTTARRAADVLAGRLDRLERIGTHVRLVSLNASVEAARVGEDGRGLSVIAREFKNLAEEIQALTKEARGDVSVMTQHQ